MSTRDDELLELIERILPTGLTVADVLAHWSSWAYHKGAEARWAISARDLYLKGDD